MDRSLNQTRNAEFVLSGLAEYSDVIEGRVDGPDVPNWAERRDWLVVIDGLDERTLTDLESGTPMSQLFPSGPLRELAEFVSAAAAVAPHPNLPRKEPSRQGISDSKTAQIRGVAELARAVFSKPRRVVDLGSGHGHVTRELGQALSCDFVGYDRDPERIERARTLGGQFETLNVGEDAPELQSGDLVVGLHACGELGDQLLQLAVDAQCQALLVACCPQKRQGQTYRPRSAVGQRSGLSVRHDALGLANLVLRKHAVETTWTENRRGRMHRYALRLLLRSRGLTLGPGDEMRHLNRRFLLHDFVEVAKRACELRNLRLPTPAEVESHRAVALRDSARIRRFAAVRGCLGAPLELGIALDRAVLLEEQGRKSGLQRAFSPQASPRNLALFGL